VAALAAVRLFVVPPDRLGPVTIDATVGSPPVRAGEQFVAPFGGFEPHGPDPVHFRKVRVTGVPSGMRIVGIYANDGAARGGIDNGPPDPKTFPNLRPVTDIVLRASDQYEAWGIVIVFEGTKPGVWETTGIDVDWKAGWYRGTAHYGYKLRVTVTG
jgi:hypothetical protein